MPENVGKWIPGPWIAEGPASNRIVWRDDVNRICFMAHSNGRDDERDIATSNLIAAAPEVTESAIHLVDRDCVINGSKIIIEFDDHGEAFNALLNMRTAISKARGES